MSGFSTDNKNESILGGGVPGVQPISGCGGSRIIQFGNVNSINRSVLRKSFGNMYNNGLGSSPLTIASKGNSLCGSFRTALMAGDVLGSVNSSTNIKYGVEHKTLGKLFPTRNNINPGGVRRDGDSSYSGNPRHVYDASDFIRYKKLKSINQVYNDKSFGGDESFAQQHAWRRLTR